MNTSMQAIAGLYKFDSGLFPERIGGLSDDEAKKTVSDHSNPILWIAGHIASTRYHVLSLLGESRDFPWPKVFNEPFNPAVTYPKVSEVAGAWTQVSNPLIEKLGRASEDVLGKELEYQLPHGVNTVAGACIFFAYHEAWHLGQIAYIRKCLGMDGLVPY